MELVLVIVFIIIWIAISQSQKDTIKSNLASTQDEQQRFIDAHCKNVVVDYTFTTSNNLDYFRYIVDIARKEVIVFNITSRNEYAITSQKYIIPFSEITGCEILSDSEVMGGVGRAVVGGAIAGGVGAIVGANTARKYIKSYKVIIYRSNIANPQHEMTLISSDTSTQSDDYVKATDFAQKINASIKSILSTSLKFYR